MSLHQQDRSSYDNLVLKDTPVPTKISMRSTKTRWFALFLICLINFGNYYCVDNPQALQSSLEDLLKIKTTQFNLFYTLYSLPNIIVPFFGGVITDFLGVRFTILLFSGITIAGQFLFTIGGYLESYAVMLTARVVFGVGAETLTSAQTVITSKWFVGKELAFSFGLTLCIARMGSALNSLMTPLIYDWGGQVLYIPLFVGFVLCVLSFLACFPLCSLDKAADKQEGENTIKIVSEKVSLKDLKSFTLIYYLMLLCCFFFYGAFFGLTDNLNDLMQDRFGFTQAGAGRYITIVYLIGGILLPLFGFIVDKKGKRVTLMIVASIGFALTHLYIAFLNDHPTGDPNYWMVLALVSFGLSYCCYASIFWPSVPLIVEEKIQGSAFGIIFCLQSGMQALIPILTGAIHDNTEEVGSGYFWTEILLAALVVIALFITIWIYFVDKKTGRRLEGVQGEEDKYRKLTEEGDFLDKSNKI